MLHSLKLININIKYDYYYFYNVHYRNSSLLKSIIYLAVIVSYITFHLALIVSYITYQSESVSIFQHIPIRNVINSYIHLTYLCMHTTIEIERNRVVNKISDMWKASI